MPKQSLILALLATLVLSACATGVQSPVVRFDRQVNHVDAGGAATQPSVTDLRPEVSAKTK